MLSGKYRVNEAADPTSRAGRKDRRMMETEWRPESMLIAEKLKTHAEAQGIIELIWVFLHCLRLQWAGGTWDGPYPTIGDCMHVHGY